MRQRCRTPAFETRESSARAQHWWLAVSRTSSRATAPRLQESRDPSADGSPVRSVPQARCAPTETAEATAVRQACVGPAGRSRILTNRGWRSNQCLVFFELLARLAVWPAQYRGVALIAAARCSARKLPWARRRSRPRLVLGPGTARLVTYRRGRIRCTLAPHVEGPPRTDHRHHRPGRFVPRGASARKGL